MADAPSEHGSVRYEHKDIRLGCLLAIIGLVPVFLVIGLVAVWKLYWFEAGQQDVASRSAYPPVTSPAAPLPPQPRLEELNRMANVDASDGLQKQLQSLHSSGKSAEKGFSHIPIDQAIKTVAGALPVRKRAPIPPIKDRGLVDSGESNSGRMFRGETP